MRNIQFLFVVNKVYSSLEKHRIDSIHITSKVKIVVDESSYKHFKYNLFIIFQLQLYSNYD